MRRKAQGRGAPAGDLMTVPVFRRGYAMAVAGSASTTPADTLDDTAASREARAHGGPHARGHGAKVHIQAKKDIDGRTNVW
jgi:hypothetical protein